MLPSRRTMGNGPEGAWSEIAPPSRSGPGAATGRSPPAPFWKLRTGALWHDPSARCDSWQTCSNRSVRRRYDGTCDQPPVDTQPGPDAVGELVREARLDGRAVRAHRLAAEVRRRPDTTNRKRGDRTRGRGVRMSPRRADDQAVPDARRVRLGSGDRADGGPAAREHATRGHAPRDPGPASHAGPAAEAPRPVRRRRRLPLPSHHRPLPRRHAREERAVAPGGS